MTKSPAKRRKSRAKAGPKDSLLAGIFRSAHPSTTAAYDSDYTTDDTSSLPSDLEAE